MTKKLKESLLGHTSSHTVYPVGGDANTGHGYGTLNTRMVPKKMQNGWPYDPEEIVEPDEWDYSLDPVEKKKFNNKLGYGHVSLDPNARYDMRSMFDDQFTMENKNLREVIKLILEDAFRLRPGSSEPDFVTNQFGQKVNGGTQFGWSSAFPFDDKESREPVDTFQDIVDKHNEREGIIDNQ